jgi:hypothetical protein
MPERSIRVSALTTEDAGRNLPSSIVYPGTSMPKSRITYDTIRNLALSLPGVEESTSYGTPALKVKGKLFVRLHDDGDKIVLKMPFDRREEMMADDPKTYFITDHYREYPWVLVSLAHVRADALPDLLNIAYHAASPAKKRRV